MNRVLGLRLSRFVPVGLIGLAAAVLLAPAPASATPYVVKLVQQGSNVVATGSGEFDLSGLTLVEAAVPQSFIWPSDGLFRIGTGVLQDQYSGLTGAPSFGSGAYTYSSTTGGDAVGVDGAGVESPSIPYLFVPHGYVSGNALSDSATWDNASFTSLGVTAGTYVWTWGSAADQTFTLIIGGSMPAVPEPAALGMFGFGVLLIGGFVGLRRRAA